MLSRNKKIAIYLSIAIIVGMNIVILWLIFLPAKNTSQTITINNNVIKVELATSFKAQYRGLSNRSYLCPNCGMLFVFSDKSERKFVMREMEFPLDIIFIADNRIVKIDANLSPEGENYTKIYSSGQAVNLVLELNSGYSARHNIKVGAKVIIK